MARSVDDLVLALDIIAGPDEAADGRAYRLNLPPARGEKLSDFRVLVIAEHPLRLGPGADEGYDRSKRAQDAELRAPIAEENESAEDRFGRRQKVARAPNTEDRRVFPVTTGTSQYTQARKGRRRRGEFTVSASQI
jgi:Asp-tRNA(Asn)/Glu-tRNA(Gln) amidotransferase A subunit family amidase